MQITTLRRQARSGLRCALLGFGAAAAFGACAKSVVVMPTTLEGRAQAAVAALARHDMGAVATLVDSTRGLRFSPYSSVDTIAGVRLSPADVARLWSDTTQRDWGQFDGTGAEMRLTFREYYQRFVYDADFADSAQVSINAAPLGRGNARNNIAAVYPAATRMEYYWPGGDKAMGGLDWRSLWLVFERRGDTWSLVAIIHVGWTI